MMERAEFIRRLETKEDLGRFDRARDAVGSYQWQWWTDATWVLICRRSEHALSVLTIAFTICDFDGLVFPPFQYSWKSLLFGSGYHSIYLVVEFPERYV